MKINILSPMSAACANPYGTNRYFGWPSVCRLADGTLAAVASGFRLSHICPFGKVVLFRSGDEGKSWSAPEIILDTPLDDRDAGICVFGEGGRNVIVTSFNNTPAFQRRYNKDNTYVQGYLDTVEKRGDLDAFLGSAFVISRDGGRTFGEFHRCPVTSPHGPCVLKDGSLLWVGRLFADTQGESCDCHVQAWRVREDGGCEFVSAIKDVSPDLLSCEPHAAVLPDGRIIVHIRVQRGGPDSVFTTYQSISDDNGATFSDPVPLLEQRGGAPAHLMLHSSGLLISVYGYREKPYGIRAMFSRDGGATWDADNIIFDGGPSSDLGYPASVELRDGSILTVFYMKSADGGSSDVKQIIWRAEE